MVRFFLIVLGISTIFLSVLKADEKKALRHLDRKEYEKVIQTLENDLEKDTINPGVKYIYSVLYMEELFEKKDIDTAYSYIQECINDFYLADKKDLGKLAKIGIDDSTINIQKARIEVAAFHRCQYIHTIESYNDFITRFGDSDKAEDAEVQRNTIAYDDAERENTFMSYQNFIDTYPNAREVKKAERMFDRLLYEGKTADGTLQSYEEFIRYYPSSPYLEEAKETVYNIRTANNDIQGYIDFLVMYPGSEIRDRALNFIYHIYKEENDPRDFRYEYDFLKPSDSLLQVSLSDPNFIFPIYENEKYGFMDQYGTNVINIEIADIKKEYLCGEIREDYLLISDRNKGKIISKRGKIIYDQNFYNVEDLGYGLLKISYNGKYGLIHKSGYHVLPIEYYELDLLDGRFIKYKEKDFFGLQTVSGRSILDEKYDDIREEGAFIILEKEDLIAVTRGEILMGAVHGKPPQLNFRYDEVELVDEGTLLCFREDMETVVGKDLKHQIEFQPQEIYEIPGGWLIKKDSVYELYDEIFYNLAGSGLEKVETKGDLVSVKRNGKYALYDYQGAFPKEFHFDSVSLLSNQIAIVRRDQEYKVIFRYGGLRDLVNPKNTRLLRSAGTHQTMEYLMTKNQKGQTIVYNKYGKEVLKGKVSDIQPLGDEYLVFRKNNKVGMADSSGRVLLKPEFAGIANYNQGYVTTMKDKKFGIYNKNKGLKISPQYDVSPKSYNDQLIIASENRRYGFVDFNNNEITAFEFGEIQYWNDSTALCRTEEDIWVLYNIYNQFIVLDDIRSFYSISEFQNNKIILFSQEEYFGIASTRDGLIINPSFSDIVNIGSAEDPVYFAEKYIPEAEFFVVIYYNKSGGILRKQVFTNEEYGKIYCE